MRNHHHPKVLLLQNRIATYRKEVYEEIAKSVDLTVGYTDKDELNGSGGFRRIQLTSWRIKSVLIQKPGFFKFCSNYDVVIFVGDMHNLSFCLLPFLPGNFKSIAWTIGFRASYSRPFNIQRKHDALDWVYGKLLSACDACVFYTEQSVEFWKGAIDRNKIFVAHNTVHTVPQDVCAEKKKNILFVGTLYKGKGVEQIIKAYANIRKSSNPLLPLIIVGDGPERSRLEKLTSDLSLDDVVKFHGAIYDELKLAKIFENALVCISPTQAGLSVLKSMGYGTPFATMENSITGGEILNIKPGQNGFLFKRNDDLECFIRNAPKNRDNLVKMGVAAKEYYLNNATTEIQAKGVVDAINYVLSIRRKSSSSFRGIIRHFALSTLGFFSRLRPGVYILNGHITSHGRPDPEVFAKLLSDLQKRGIKFLNFDDAIQRIHRHEIPAEPCVAFSFDDGLEEHASIIAPTLEQFGITGGFFVTPGFIDGDDDYIQNFSNHVVKTPGKRPATWTAIQRLSERGHTIGAHTMNHISLNCEDSEKLEYEIGKCKEIIEDKCGRCDCFAIPYWQNNQFGEKARQIAKRNYKYIFTQDKADCVNYFSPENQAMTRRHFEPTWPVEHILYFLGKGKVYND